MARGPWPHCQLYADAVNSERRHCLAGSRRLRSGAEFYSQVRHSKAVWPRMPHSPSSRVCSLPGRCANPGGPARDNPACLPAAELNLGALACPQPWCPLRLHGQRPWPPEDVGAPAQLLRGPAEGTGPSLPHRGPGVPHLDSERRSASPPNPASRQGWSQRPTQTGVVKTAWVTSSRAPCLHPPAKRLGRCTEAPASWPPPRR